MRVIAFTALAALVAGVLAVFSGCGEDGESTVAAPAPTTVAQPAPAPTTPAATTKAPQTVKPSKPQAEPQQASAADAVEAVCPPKLTKAQCRELGRAAKQLGPSHVVKSGKCPRSMTREECEELARALKQVGPSHVVEPSQMGRCEPPLTPADCEAAARSQQ